MTETIENTNTSDRQASPFPIVGIGASAGGLESFEQFFKHMPADSGFAFVLIPHLDPSHGSLLSDILQRSTTMPVKEAMDQVPVEANCVYIISPQSGYGNLPRGLATFIPGSTARPTHAY